MAGQNCWEFRKCGREPGGRNVNEFGICPAATETRVDGVNNGKNGGRTCWAIAGTLCGGKVQGTFAAKIATCQVCEFHARIQQELEAASHGRREHELRALNMVLEHTAALEREIEHRQKVEDALHRANTKLNLISHITRHDMLNKLGSIGLIIDLLKEKYSGDPAILEYLGKADVQLQNVEEMIWFSSDYHELGSKDPAWQNIPKVIDGIRGWVLETSIEYDPDLAGYEIFADPLLSKVFYNLADNAVRHGERVSSIRVSAEIRNEDLIIIWEDDGTGVPYDEKEKIFNKGHGRNTGLGLFLVREILSITGITIRETGTPGTGARFEILVPAGEYRRRDDDESAPVPGS
jgi:signal transduction histidine kinase